MTNPSTDLAIASERHTAGLARGQAALLAVAEARATLASAENTQAAATAALDTLASLHVAATPPTPEDVSATLDGLDAANRGAVWATAVLAASQRELQASQEEMRAATVEYDAASEAASRAALKNRVRQLVAGNA